MRRINWANTEKREIIIEEDTTITERTTIDNLRRDLRTAIDNLQKAQKDVTYLREKIKDVEETLNLNSTVTEA